MSWLISGWRGAVWVLFCLWWTGCSLGESGLEEEKDANYLAGRSRKATLNYPAAVEAFERALETNPRSAAAHFELGLIYYQNITTNWARAIYHFEKYLELRPKANNADLVRQNIDYCKLALAREVPYTPNNDLVRKEVEHLARENADLRQQIDHLTGQLALRPAGATSAVTTLNAAISARQAASARVPSNSTVQYAQAAESTGALLAANDTARTPAASKTHVVKSGDTPYSIARNYGVKLASLEVANPGLVPRRLRPGQTLVIPFQ